MIEFKDFLDVFKKKTLNKWARKTGFIKRQKSLTALDFLLLMTVGQLGMKHPSLASMVDAIESKIRRESLHDRFTESAFKYLEMCTKSILSKKSQAKPICTKLLKKFNRLLIVDSSSWDISSQLSTVLPGSGGNASNANCKVQAFYEYKKGDLSFFEITSGINPDNKYTRQIPGKIQPKDLLLIDLGYFSFNTFHRIIQKGAFFLSRFRIRTKLWDPETSNPIDLKKMLSKVTDNAYQMEVQMGTDQEAKICCRLICFRVAEDIANKRRMKLIKEAKKKGRTPSPQNLILANWTLMITNIPEEWIPSKMLWPIYSIRWQIELLFKQIKSILQVHRSNTANEYRLKCEIYGKLIVAVLIHRVHGTINSKLWNMHRKELSMDKFYKRMQERAFLLLQLLLASPKKAIVYLSNEVKRLIKNCIKYRQPSRKSTLQLIEEGIDLKVLELKAKT